MYLKVGLQHLWSSIRSHKILFLLLIVLQFSLIFVTLSQILIPSLVEVAEKVDTITAGLETATLDTEQIQAGEPFLEDMILIQTAYARIMASLQKLLLLLLLCFILGNGLLWILSHQLLHPAAGSWKHRGKSLLQSWLKYCAASAIVFIPFLAIVFFVLRSFILAQGDVTLFEQLIKGTGYVVAVLYYFLLIAFSGLHTSWKAFTRRIFTLGIRSSIKTLLLFGIGMALLAAVGYGLYLLVENEASFALVLFATMLFMLLLVGNRLYWIATLEVVAHEKV